MLCINISYTNTKIYKMKLEVCVCIASIKLVKRLIQGVAASKVVLLKILVLRNVVLCLCHSLMKFCVRFVSLDKVSKNI